MELVANAEGDVAPRLNDVALTHVLAVQYHAFLLNQVVRMLCAGIVHGDLSEFNILLGTQGPVIIDLPQAVDAAGNNEAAAMLFRDVRNLATYFGQFAPELLTTEYGREIWKLFESGELTPETELTGLFEADTTPVDMADLMSEIEASRREEEERLRRLSER